ncbi:MAG: PatB family C-S lyase [Pisciglobus halotolerans]|nr:PatB family C-S lyase [Pisciglobus halotolerans]
MKSLFDQPIDRTGTNSVKWDTRKSMFGSSDILPMWIADMDFPCPEPVLNSLRKVIDSRVIGYSFAPDSLYEAICQWQKNHHQMVLKKDMILFSPGVVTSLALCVQTLTNQGESVLIQDPVYPPFSEVITLNNRKLLTSPLKIEHNTYRMDFNDIEQKIQDNDVKLFLLCSPHNPGGRVWTAGELRKLLDICQKHGVYVVSDEIHGDLVYQPEQFHSTVTLKDDYASFVVTLTSPTKTFNLAGIKNSVLLVPNPDIRRLLQEEQEKSEMNAINTFGYVAMETAFSEGASWHLELMAYLERNLEMVCNFFDKELPSVFYMKPEATYLFWFDCSSLGISGDKLTEVFAEVGKIGLNAGIAYGKEGTQFMRFNFASRKELVQESLIRIKKVFDLYTR